MKPDNILRDLPAHTGRAVAHYWRTRTGQQNRQRATGKADQGLRSAVTRGAQMDGFVDLFTTAELRFEKAPTETAALVKEEPALYGVRPAKKKLE